jgi:hypothetical protein
VNQTRPAVILQAHATRSLTALALLLHARDRGARDLRKPLNSLVASLLLAVVIVGTAAVAARVGSIIQQH